jgi:hypothetical protein
MASARLATPRLFILIFIHAFFLAQKQLVSIEYGAQRVRGVNTLMLWRMPFDQRERRVML